MLTFIQGFLPPRELRGSCLHQISGLLLGSRLFLWVYEFKFYAATLVQAHDIQAVLHVLR